MRAREEMDAAKSAIMESLVQKASTLSSELAESENKVKDFSTYIARLESRLDQTEKEKLEEFGKALDSFEVELRGKLSSAARRGETLEDEVFARLSSRIQENEAAVAESIQIIENRLADYQGDVEYRVKSLEESSNDVDALRASLSESMEKVAAGVRTEMKAMGAELIAGWTAEIAGATVAREQLRAGIAELESGLSSLKAQAYQDVEKKLSVFEDEFLVDLRARSAAMQEKLQTWQSEIETRAAAFETDVKERIGAADGSIQTLRETIRGEMERVKKDASLSFEKDLTGVRDTMEAGTRKMHREIEARLKELSVELDAGRKEISELFEAARAEVKAWETRSRQLLVETEVGITEKISALSGQASSSISAIRDGFAAQREDILVSINEDRAALRTELSAMESRTMAFETDLKERIAASEESIQALGESMRAGDGTRRRRTHPSLFDKELGGVRDAVEAGTRKMHREIEARLKELGTELDRAQGAGGSLRGLARRRSPCGRAGRSSSSRRRSWRSRTGSPRSPPRPPSPSATSATGSPRRRKTCWSPPTRSASRFAQGAGGNGGGHLQPSTRAEEDRRTPQWRRCAGQMDTFQVESQKRMRELQTEVEGRIKEHKQLLAETREKSEAMQDKLFGEDRGELPPPVGEPRGDRQAGEGLPVADAPVRARGLHEGGPGRHHRGDEEGDGEAVRRRGRGRRARAAACPHEEDRGGGLRQAHAVPLGEAAHRGHGRRVQEDHRPFPGRGPEAGHPLGEQRRSPADPGQDPPVRGDGQDGGGRVREAGEEEGDHLRHLGGRGQELPAPGGDREVAAGSGQGRGRACRQGPGPARRVRACWRATRRTPTRPWRSSGKLEVGHRRSWRARLEKAQSSREWMARTETRFEEIGRQAQEQVRLLESIIKAETKKEKGERGAPPLDKRETVVKLSHQGWSVQEISRVTQLSRGEVELILELAPKV